MEVKLSVNGKPYDVDVEPRTLLVDLLRELGFLSVHQGCDEGRCGACTIVMDGEAIKSCLLFAVQADGASIVTTEGLARDDGFHPLQTAFSECLAVQCGYCTPGMILTGKALLDENQNPSEADVKRAIEGNICRCTGYYKIIEAILNVAKEKHAL